jgi:hypothetical protein
MLLGVLTIGVSPDSLAYSSLRSLGAPVINTPGNRPKLACKTFWRQIHESQDSPVCVFITGESILLIFTIWESRLPGVYTTERAHSPLYSPPGSCFGHQGVILQNIRACHYLYRENHSQNREGVNLFL